MDIESQRRVAAILNVLSVADSSVGSSRIAKELRLQGIELKERMVRYYLEETDRLGFTMNLGRRGRMITERGRKELESAVAVDRVGFVSAHVDEFAYKTTFDLKRRSGTVVLNRSTLPGIRSDEVKEIIRTVMDARLGMGRYITITNGRGHPALEGEENSWVTIGTVCGITLNGVFRAEGIPMTAKFGGLLEVRNGQPTRFTQIIQYDGTTLDPIEIFIKGKMTRVTEAARDGHGTVGASFREIPAAALPRAREIIGELEDVGLCNVLLLGEVGRPLLDVPVSPGRVGAIVAAGLNPIAAAEEQGIPTESFAMSTLCDFSELLPVF